MESVFSFDEYTEPKVMAAITTAYIYDKHVRLWYGDQETGRAWAEENDVLGIIGRSTGERKVPLLITADGDGLGGGAILTNRILRIDIGNTYDNAWRTTYQHPKFHVGKYTLEPSDLPGYVAAVLLDNEIHARFTNVPSACGYIAFMTGLSHERTYLDVS